MRRMVRLWPFTEYECEEAETWLNEKAAEGYRLTAVSGCGFTLFNGWARFEKWENAADFRYSVDIAAEEDHDYIQLCRDAGWAPVGRVGDCMFVFESDAVTEKPLYSDELSRLERQISYRNGAGGGLGPLGSVIAMVLGLAALIWMAAVASDFYWAFLFGVIWLPYYHKGLNRVLLAVAAYRAAREGSFRKSRGFRILGRIFNLVNPAGLLALYIAMGVVYGVQAPLLYVAGIFVLIVGMIAGNLLWSLYEKKVWGACVVVLALTGVVLQICLIVM